MLRMQPFEVHTPRTAAEAVALRASLPDAHYLAGGTDLLPNLKHGLHDAAHLVHLGGVAELVGIEESADGALRIGAGTSLHAVQHDARILAGAAPLADAAGAVAGPQHRRMGTLGGNVMLDTRCLFYNQSASWRTALGYCLKREGDWCHVIDTPKRCVAAHSADTVPALIALDATLEVVDPERGAFTLSLDDLYQQDGRTDQNRALHPAALLVAIHVPPRAAGHRGVYRKVRARGAVDFPQLSLAIAGALDADGTVRALTAVISAVLPKPKRLRGFDAAVGAPLDDATIEALAEQVFKQTHPQTSLHGDPSWRRHMARVETRRALQALRGD